MALLLSTAFERHFLAPLVEIKSAIFSGENGSHLHSKCDPLSPLKVALLLSTGTFERHFLAPLVEIKSAIFSGENGSHLECKCDPFSPLNSGAQSGAQNADFYFVGSFF